MCVLGSELYVERAYSVLMPSMGFLLAIRMVCPRMDKMTTRIVMKAERKMTNHGKTELSIPHSVSDANWPVISQRNTPSSDVHILLRWLVHRMD